MIERNGRTRKSVPKPPKTADGRMPLMDHLRELRNRLVKSLIAVLIATCVAAFYYKHIAEFLIQPACGLKQIKGTGVGKCNVIVQQGVLDPFSMMLKVSLVAGIVASSPVWAYQLWAFLAPGLHKAEKKYTLSFVGIGVPLFLGGAFFSYSLLPHAIPVLLGFTPGDITNQINLDVYLQFVLRMVVVFGIACELPLILVLLNFGRVVTAKQLAGWWRWVVMLIFVFGAVATPTTDPLTMCLLSVPMCLLYVIAVGICWVNDRRRGRRDREAFGGDVPDDEASPLDTRPGTVGPPSPRVPDADPVDRVDDIT